MKFDTILWDIDQTLLDFLKSEDKSLRETALFFGYTLTDEDVSVYSESNRICWKKYETGEYTSEDIKLNRYKELFERIHTKDIDLDAFQNLYKKGLSEYFFPMEGVYEVLDFLKDKCRMYAITNGDSYVQRHKMSLCGLDKYMDDLFVSGELGAVKPSDAFFEKCFAAIPDFSKERTVIIGDSLTSDIQGAVRNGIYSIRLWPPNEEEREIERDGLLIKPNVEIRKLTELKEMDIWPTTKIRK